MEKTPTTAGRVPTPNDRQTNTLEYERREQLEETRRWISANALKALRNAWRH